MRKMLRNALAMVVALLLAVVVAVPARADLIAPDWDDSDLEHALPDDPEEIEDEPDDELEDDELDDKDELEDDAGSDGFAVPIPLAVGVAVVAAGAAFFILRQGKARTA